MSLSTNVRPPRFSPSVLPKVNVGCRRRCACPELCPVSNKDCRHPSMPAAWPGSSGQSMEWDGRNSCASEGSRSCCLTGAAGQGQMQANQSSLWCHLASMMAADPSSFQIPVGHGNPSFHGGAWQGSSSQLPRAAPTAPWVLLCVSTIPLLWVTLQGPTTSDLLKSGGTNTPSTRHGCLWLFS